MRLGTALVLATGLLFLAGPLAEAQTPDAYGAGSAVVLDGSGDYVDLPNDPAINTDGPYEKRTIELWFKADDVSGSTEQVLYEEGGDQNGFNLYVKDGRLYAGGWSEDRSWQGDWLSTTDVQNGTWHHAALVFDEPSGVLRAYLDGEQFGDTTPGSKMDGHTFEIGIGAANQNTKFDGNGDFFGDGRSFTGRIDQVRLWQGRLSKQQVRARAKRKVDLNSSVADSLIASYRLDTGSDTIAYDYATADGTAQDGSFSGDPQWADYSGAQFGDVSAALTGGSATVGAAGGTVTAENVSDTLQVYRYGENDGPLLDSTRAAEDFSGLTETDRRVHVVWGLDAVGTATADVTFDFSGLSGVNDPSSVVLLKRAGPGDAWMDVTGDWTRDAGAQTFSKTGVSSFSQYAIGGTAQTLPVELAAFEASRTEGAVQLQWTTASETNNAGFRVQRRISDARASGGRRDEAGSSWSTIGRREGAGTTTEAQTYRFTDGDLPYEADALSYRLKQVDTDGTVHYSDPITVERGGVQGATLEEPYPNPVRGQMTVRIAVPEEADGKARVALYDVLGRRMRTVVNEPVKGRVQRTVDVSGLSSGTYVLRLETGGTAQTQQVTVVR